MNKLIPALLLCASASVSSAGVVETPVTTWTYSGAELRHASDVDGNFWVPYDSEAVGVFVSGTPVFDGMHLVGSGANNRVFVLGGAQYQALTNPSDSNFAGNQLRIFGEGTIDPTRWTHPIDLIRTTFNFGFGLTGGEMNILGIGSQFILTDSIGAFITGVGSGTGGFGPYSAGDYGLGVAFEDRFGTDITNASRIFWEVTIRFDWTGMNTADTLTFTIPDNSIDINHVPTPGAASVLALGGLAATRRRR